MEKTMYNNNANNNTKRINNYPQMQSGSNNIGQNIKGQKDYNGEKTNLLVLCLLFFIVLAVIIPVSVRIMSWIIIWLIIVVYNYILRI